MVRDSDGPAGAARRRSIVALAVATLAVAALACSGIPTPAAPAGSGGSTGSGSQTGGNATLTVVNQTSSTVCFLRVSPTTNSEWGDDRLGSDTIAGGASYSLAVPAGSYDLRAEFCGGGETTQMGISISGSYTWTLTGGASSGGQTGSGNIDLRVVNNTSETVCFMRISSSSSSEWGPDWLGSNTISSGSSFDFYVAAGSYDLRAEFCGGGERTQTGVSITSSYVWTLQ